MKKCDIKLIEKSPNITIMTPHEKSINLIRIARN